MLTVLSLCLVIRPLSVWSDLRDLKSADVRDFVREMLIFGVLMMIASCIAPVVHLVHGSATETWLHMVGLSLLASVTGLVVLNLYTTICRWRGLIPSNEPSADEDRGLAILGFMPRNSEGLSETEFKKVSELIPEQASGAPTEYITPDGSRDDTVESIAFQTNLSLDTTRRKDSPRLGFHLGGDLLLSGS